MKRFLNTQTEFKEAEMHGKTKECQAMRWRSYQHQGDYLEEIGFGIKIVILMLGTPQYQCYVKEEYCMDT